jgi:transcriptional regulator with XRE-family HTH domain
MTQTPTAVCSSRIREIRGARGLSASALANRLADLGRPELNRSVIANIENGRRDAISLEELVAFALALDVAPLDLVTPAGESAAVTVLPDWEEDAIAFRSWFAGEEPLDRVDAEAYFDQPHPRLVRARRRLQVAQSEAHLRRLMGWQRRIADRLAAAGVPDDDIDAILVDVNMAARPPGLGEDDQQTAIERAAFVEALRVVLGSEEA